MTKFTRIQYKREIILTFYVSLITFNLIVVYNNGNFLNKRLKQVINSKLEKEDDLTPKQKIYDTGNVNRNLSLSKLNKNIKLQRNVFTPVIHKISIKSNHLPKLSIFSNYFMDHIFV